MEDGTLLRDGGRGEHIAVPNGVNDEGVKGSRVMVEDGAEEEEDDGGERVGGAMAKSVLWTTAGSRFDSFKPDDLRL